MEHMDERDVQVENGDTQEETEKTCRSKRRKIWIVLPLFLLLFALPITVALLTQNRTPLSAQEFTVRMEEKGFVVVSLDTEAFEQAHLRVETHWLFMEFIVYSDESAAESAYADNIRQIQHLRQDEGYAIAHMQFANAERFTLAAGGYHIVVSRIGNTVLFAVTMPEYNRYLNRLSRELGY